MNLHENDRMIIQLTMIINYLIGTVAYMMIRRSIWVLIYVMITTLIVIVEKRCYKNINAVEMLWMGHATFLIGAFLCCGVIVTVLCCYYYPMTTFTIVMIIAVTDAQFTCF